ncbi:MAG TPA: cation:proton antiporter [Thermoplasmata archaeon]|nr:cation:proton antiporter [Thermoplasmata archaeon]
MVDTWVSLLVAGTLLLVGFAASLVFQKYRVPDFILLMLLGFGLSLIPFAPFGPGLLQSLAPLLPLFTQLTIAFILFEGGLSLRLRDSGRSVPAIVAHGLIAMGLTAFLIWFLLTRFFAISETTALVVAMAFSGPSASVALSFAPRMHLDPRAENAIVLEGVLTNVIAVIGVLLVLEWYGSPGNFFLVPYLAQVGEAIGLGVVLGFGWGRVVDRLAQQRFVSMATLGLAIVVYAAAQGFLAQNGALAVFVLGLVVGIERKSQSTKKAAAGAASRPPSPDDVLRELSCFVEATDGPRPSNGSTASPSAMSLRNFQSEITFALRTFFFIYLGLLLASEWGGTGSILVSVLLVAVFLLGRLPTTAALGWGLALYPRDTRAVYASMARGMTDVVLVLFAVQSGILPQPEVQFILGIIPTVVLLAAVASAALVVWAGHSPGATQVAVLRPNAIAAADGSRREP